MRSCVGQLVVPLLVVLLSLTTPVGMGDGVHKNALLDPVLPHLHLINGQFVSDQQLAAARRLADALTQSTHGVSLGAGAAADAAGLGLALGPTLPALQLARFTSPELRWFDIQGVPPPEFRDAPQDPPPDA